MRSKTQAINLYDSTLSKPRMSPPSDHRRQPTRPLAGHKFAIGQTVVFSPSIYEPAARKGNYRVVGLLPSDGGNIQYRVKSELDGHERVVREGQCELLFG